LFVPHERYYGSMAAKAGCVGMTGTNARPSVCATFGVEPVLGTNPLCFGIPSDEDFPFLIDCATSIIQRGKIEQYERSQCPTPVGVVTDATGQDRSDTSQILKDLQSGHCSLCPVGGRGDDLAGYKGYGWSTAVELLSSAFQSGAFGPDLKGVDGVTGAPQPMLLGHFFLAIDVESLVNLQTFEHNVGNVLRYLRGSAKDPFGPGRIWTAGEPEHDSKMHREAAGGCLLPPLLLNQLQELRDTLPGLKEKYPTMPFEHK
jgi:L-2-hydroxycarboxylate dehydrogenase (NAD+)